MLLPLLLATALQSPSGPRTKPGPLAENAAALAALRSAPRVEVRHVDGPVVLESKTLRRDDPGAKALLAALADDFAKRPNDDEYKCGFHADVALVPAPASPAAPKPPAFELCFGCGEVRADLPPTKAAPFRRRLQWLMNDREALKRAVHALYPTAVLGRGR